MASRVLAIFNGLVEVIEQFHPNVLAVEQLYAHYKHPRTAILMGHARWRRDLPDGRPAAACQW